MIFTAIVATVDRAPTTRNRSYFVGTIHDHLLSAGALSSPQRRQIVAMMARLAAGTLDGTHVPELIRQTVEARYRRQIAALAESLAQHAATGVVSDLDVILHDGIEELRRLRTRHLAHQRHLTTVDGGAA